VKLIHRIDCTQDIASPEKFISYGQTQVVHAPCGNYRESAADAGSRFCYRLPVNAGKPHLLKVFYPDDKRRFMTIGDGTSYDLNTAVTTGWAWPLSGKIQTLEEIFWPRFVDLSICFMVFGCDEPAAVAGFEIYELAEAELTSLPIADSGEGRKFGLMYEDPCGIGSAEGAKTFDVWLTHVVQYMKYTGQNVFTYPLCWYHGPLYPGTKERASVFGLVTEDDRTIYNRWSDHPHDWVAEMLTCFDREDIEFYGVFTLLRLSSLMEKMNIDRESIMAGAPTVNNMLWNNQVQSGTMDWTGVYNTIIFQNLDKMEKDGGLNAYCNRTFAYGERGGQKDVPPGPIFNPLHPFVQEHIIAFFRDTAIRYQAHKSFRGFSVTLWAPTLLWFGSLRSGYDDYTIAEFEKDTGIKIPGAPLDPERFSQRFHFLTYQCRNIWIDWRCRRIKQFIGNIRDAVTAVRADLRLSLTLWNEPLIGAVRDGSCRPEHQLGVRSSMREIYREAGIDPNFFTGEHNIDFALQTEGGGRDRTGGNNREAPLEAFCMFRDHDFLDQSTWEDLRKQEKPAVFVFNAWHESWGKHTWIPTPCPTDASIYGGKPDGTCIMHSEYVDDGFWWDSQLRITTATPPAPHYLEYFAHALAECDAVKLTAGGLFMDKTHFREFRQFSTVYRRLPARRFVDVPGADDPVKIRMLNDGKVSFCYMVNREYYPVKVCLQRNGSGIGENLATGECVTENGELVCLLGPYELAGFRWNGTSQITVTEISPDAVITGQIQQEARRILGLLKIFQQTQTTVFPSIPETETRIQNALTDFHPALLRRLMRSYSVRLVLQKMKSADITT